MLRVVPILILALVAASVDAKVKVTVFYEHLCPDSIRWVSNQLAPNYDALRNYIDLEFIPFGKATSINGGESFECQHGPLECEGNRIQSCVLDRLPQQDAQVSFVTCQMNFAADPRGWECTFRSGVDLVSTQNCVEGIQGVQLQLEAERRTQQIPLTFVPSFSFNDQFDSELNDLAFQNFPAALCRVDSSIAGCQ
ncbi:GILT-like protein 1 [Armigeres subalbatus]|uniref:GILT-like protein 1 n=1 Tax=Armigeres subalbatus TaxID=124917 RepID=UPI002ED0A9FE